MNQIHTIPPLYSENSTILLLGSFPSVKSREQGFFYGHPQNRFWRVISAVFECETPKTIPEKKSLLLSHDIALWDIIASCEIESSSDSSIDKVIPNDIGMILKSCPIKRIFTNGTVSSKLYRKLIYPKTGIESIRLPSTSPANASWPLEKLIDSWKILIQTQS
ncbi:MAG TPA: DNA-deoxyinosine glycosylase [Oscillospiraceae bacterium]|nr:DNA-deoxyinosine glycosylase [Oscillospiraceae bacterium]HPS34932.1 DNA-deoxyinosine glycosylase [Oscillospiraceae bacterium]